MLLAESISKIYTSALGQVPVLEDVSLSLADAESVSIMGPSGSGKSTLLHILGLLDPPTGGSLAIDDVQPWLLTPAAQARFRNECIGFVFQDHCLLGQCTVLENILAPTLVGEHDDNAESRARSLIERTGLTPRIDHFPSQLSGGEKQRVAIARALIRNPKLLLCDEPTGNLDAATARSVLDLILSLQRESGATLVVVTHALEIAARLPRRFSMHGRRLRESS
jgi:lipoprotein-releasing system ATP-binding protein